MVDPANIVRRRLFADLDALLLVAESEVRAAAEARERITAALAEHDLDDGAGRREALRLIERDDAD